MQATVISVKKETPDTVTIRCTVDKPFSFKPGQFMMLTLSPRGTPVKRAYSIASAPTREYIEFCVKEQPNGFVSTYLQTIPQGTSFDMEGPYGHFTFTEGESDWIVLIGAGSGIAPLRSILQYCSDKMLPVRVDLFFSNKTENDIIYREELMEWAKKENNRLFLTLTRSGEDWLGMKGRFTQQDISTHITDVHKPFYYLCGPRSFVHAMEQALEGLRVPKERVKKEMYG
jgi:ferredoxin-NADP reductase